LERLYRTSSRSFVIALISFMEAMSSAKVIAIKNASLG